MKKLLTLAAIAAMASSASAVDHLWQGDVDDLWSTGNNWTDDVYSGADLGVPTAVDNVGIFNTNGYATLVDAAGAVANEVTLGKWSHAGLLDIGLAGTLTCSTAFAVGNAHPAETNSVGRVNNVGTVDTGAFLFMNENASFNNGGTLTVGTLVLGNTTNGASVFWNTGDITVTNWMFLSNVASNTPSIFNMNGGTVDIDDRLEMAVGGAGRLNLNAGTITAGGLGLVGEGAYLIDIREGTLTAGGNHTNDLQWMVDSGWITAYGGFPGTGVSISYSAGPDETTLSATGMVGVAADYLWDNNHDGSYTDTGDNLWTNGVNWTTDFNVHTDAGVPDMSINALILNAPNFSTNPVILNSVGVVYNAIFSKWDQPGLLTIEPNGSLYAQFALEVGNGAESVSSATLVNQGSINMVRTATDGSGIIYLRGKGPSILSNSGSINVYDLLLGAHNLETQSVFSNTGDVTVENWMYLSVVASNTPAIFNMNGGTVDVRHLQMNPDAAGRLNLNGGTFSCRTVLLTPGGSYLIDVGDGEMVIDGNFAPDLNYMISEGWITAYNDYPGAVVIAVYDTATGKTTLSATGGPVADYDAWDALWTEDLSDRLADYEGDGLINLLEYAYGGNPTNADLAAVSPTIGVAADVLTHIYNRRIHAYNTSELSFDVEVTADLVIGPWFPPSVAGGTETVGPTADPTIEAVTNSIPVAGLDAGFVKLEVTEN